MLSMFRKSTAKPAGPTSSNQRNGPPDADPSLVIMTADAHDEAMGTEYVALEIACLSGRTIAISAKPAAKVGAIKELVERVEGTPAWSQLLQSASAPAPLNNEVSVQQLQHADGGAESKALLLYLIKDVAVALPDHICSLESHGGSWNGGADSMHRNLAASTLRVGGMCNIDAYNDGPDGNALFSAHFLQLADKLCDDEGSDNCVPLQHISYACVHNEQRNWPLFYEGASEYVRSTGLLPGQVISVTFSSNEHGRGVAYVWHQSMNELSPLYTRNAERFASSSLTPGVDCEFRYLHTGAMASWEEAAEAMVGLIAERVDDEALIVNVDAHNDGREAEARLSVHYWAKVDVEKAGGEEADVDSASGETKEKIEQRADNIADMAADVADGIGYRIFRTDRSWEEAYEQADAFVKEAEMCATDVISITSCSSDLLPRAAPVDGQRQQVSSGPSGGVVLLFYRVPGGADAGRS